MFCWKLVNESAAAASIVNILIYTTDEFLFDDETPERMSHGKAKSN